MASEKSVRLRYVGGSSDKVYELELLNAPGGYIVNFAFGRTGSTLQRGTKTPAPVSYEAALHIYNAMLGEKTAKGYKVIDSSTTSAVPSIKPEPTVAPDWLPQLLNAIDEPRALSLLDNPEWGMQEKHNGENRILGWLKNGSFGLNKNGEAVMLPEPIHNTLREIGRTHEVVFAGEAMNDRLVKIHDLLYRDRVLRDLPFTDRYDILAGLFEDIPTLKTDVTSLKMYASFDLSPLWVTAESKHAHYKFLKENNYEGAVFKRLESLYVPGRPASGGDHLKLKFWESTGCIVTGHNAKRSVQLGMVDGHGGVHYVGNCSIPVNKPVPTVGSIVEIKYLYITGPGGALVQPGYLGLKDAGRPEDCRLDTLKVMSR